MTNGLLGKKIGMTQIFKETGEIVPVTVIEAGPCVITQIKSAEKDGYNALQLGFGSKKEKSVNKPEAGLFKKINAKATGILKEVRVKDASGLKPSDTVDVTIFSVGEYVDVTGTSIGKGFQGGIKRWHWKGGPGSHGSTSHRRPGSIGSSSDPSRVFKGHHLPGHMGNRRVTVQGLEVIEVDKDNNLMLVKGAVPGHKGNYLIINRSFKKKKKEPVPVIKAKERKKDALKESKKSMKKRIK